MSARGTSEGFVYFIAQEPYGVGGEWMKVGWAKNPRERLATLQTGNPFPLKLVAAAPGTLADEAWAHVELREFRSSSLRRSEWFQGLNLDEIHTFGLIGGSLGDLVESAKAEGSMFGSVLLMAGAE